MNSTITKTTRVLSIDVGIVNLAYCITDFHEIGEGEEKNIEFELVHVEKVQVGTMKQTAQVLMENVIDFFRECDVINEKKIDFIYVEQQLSRAIKNCILAYSIMAYFYAEKRICISDTSMSFVAPRKKFAAIRAAMEFNENCLEGIDFDKNGSRELKKLSIQVAKKVFDFFHVDKGKIALERYKPKLDDVCDVFLQSFSIFLGGTPFQDRLKDGTPLRSRPFKNKR